MEKRTRHDDEPDDLDDYSPPAAGPGLDLGSPPPVPPRTPEYFVCLRGPCRHYWSVVTMAQEGNPEDTWTHLGIDPPRHSHHICLVVFGMETEYADDNVYECNRWDPAKPADLVRLERRQQRYRKRAAHFNPPRRWWQFWRRK